LGRMNGIKRMKLANRLLTKFTGDPQILPVLQR
jgi:hypothetical protein